jgi:hypothetical protein
MVVADALSRSGVGLYFVEPLAPRDISELAGILDRLIQANQNHQQPPERAYWRAAAMSSRMRAGGRCCS